jgi:hypothetical protein
VLGDESLRRRVRSRIVTGRVRVEDVLALCSMYIKDFMDPSNVPKEMALSSSK